MARKLQTEPDWPTTMRSRLAGGRVLGTDGSMWLYRCVPLAPVVDAASPEESLEAAEPLLAAFEELADMAKFNMARRGMARRNYRQIHMILVNVPQPWTPPESTNGVHLSRLFPAKAIPRRILMLGVRLKDKLGSSGGLKAAVESVTETLLAGSIPISDYDADYQSVHAALTRAGLKTPSDEEFRLVNAWWNNGRYPDTPTLTHTGHIHVFTNNDSVRVASDFGADDCASWPDVPGQHAISLLAVQDFDLPFVPATSYRAWWIPQLLDQGAAMVSIRAGVEPSTITREELRRNRKAWMSDVMERAESGKMDRVEEEEQLAELTAVEGAYSRGGPPTLTEASVIVGMSGIVDDPDEVGRYAGLVLRSMDNREQVALSETMLASPVRANPHLNDLPSTSVAASGIVSISRVGDKTGALVGFTERDQQPSYLEPSLASRVDSLPLAICPGATGSGKSVMALFLADQFSRGGSPVIYIDPKMGSTIGESVRQLGGQVASLDDLRAADGVFDPLRFAKSPEVGVEVAASLLMQVNPWGSEVNRANYETPLLRALSFGVKGGATCIGEALRMALAAGQAPQDMVDKVFDVADASPMFRACVGVEPGTDSLRVAEGITWIGVGDSHLDLPEPGSDPSGLGQRVAMALVRMMVFGSAMALTNRGKVGVLMIDEAWTVLSAGRSEVERLGRLARSQNVFPMLLTQRVSDATNAGLEGYISRGLILPVEDRTEAEAACRLFKLEPTPERLNRITAKATLGGIDDDGAAPNWGSMRHLRDPHTGQSIRGTIAIYADLAGRAVPVEVSLPKAFLDITSTNPEDVKRRQLEAAKATS